jgi:putative membrane protein
MASSRDNASQIVYDESVKNWLLHWLLSAVALLIVANIVPGIEVESFGSALIAAVVIGLVSATLGFLLKLLLLPFIILTLGIVYFLINGMMLMLASALVPGFRVNGLWAATLGSIVLTIVDYFLSRLV